MYTVTLTIPTLPGNDPQDAGETFVNVLRDWLDGAVDTLMLDVTDDYSAEPVHHVSIRAADVKYPEG